MTPILSTFKTTGRALVIVAALGGGLFAAAPAMAASEPSFNFNLGIAPDGQPSVGMDIQGGQANGQFPSNRHHQQPSFSNACLSDKQVIIGLYGKGFDRVEVTDSSRRSAEVSARNGRYDYTLDVNKCSGAVDVVDRSPINWNHHDHNGFGLQFNFGNH
jgi:hypothetical protein